MKILVLAPQPFMTQRGTPIAVHMLLETLSARGDESDVICFPEGDDVDIPGCRVFRVPALPGLKNFRPGFSVKKLLADTLMFPMVAARMLRGNYDLVIAVEEAAFMAMALKPIFGVPYIADIDSSLPEQLDDKFALPGWLRRCFEGAEAAVMRRADGAITCCQALEKIVRDRAPGIPVRTLEDVTMLSGEDSQPAAECAFDKPVVMYVGNLEPYQGVDLLMEAVAVLDPERHPMRLVVIGGTGEDIAAAERRAVDLGIAAHASFLGPRPVSELGHYLSAAAVVVSPRRQGRNTPMKIYSYLDSGRPLLATRLPTHTQVLDDRIACLVEPTPEAMAAGLRDLLGDPELSGRLVTAAKERVAAEFTPDAYSRKLRAFLETEIEPRLPRSPRPTVAQ